MSLRWRAPYLVHGVTHLVCKSLGQQRQRVSHKVELVWSDALAAVSSDGQGVSLSVDAEKLQVEEAGSESALQGATPTTSYGVGQTDTATRREGERRTHGLQNGFTVAPRQHFQGGQGLLRHVDKLDDLKLQTEGRWAFEHRERD